MNVWTSLESDKSIGKQNGTSMLHRIRRAVNSSKKTSETPLPCALWHENAEENVLYRQCNTKYSSGVFQVPEDAVFVGCLLIFNGCHAHLYQISSMLLMVVDSVPFAELEIDLQRGHSGSTADVFGSFSPASSLFECESFARMPSFFKSFNAPYFLVRDGPLPFLKLFVPTLETDMVGAMLYPRKDIDACFHLTFRTVFQRGLGCDHNGSGLKESLSVSIGMKFACNLFDSIKAVILDTASDDVPSSFESANGKRVRFSLGVSSPSPGPVRCHMESTPPPPGPDVGLIPDSLGNDRRIARLADLGTRDDLTSKHIASLADGAVRAAVDVCKGVFREKDVSVITEAVVKKYAPEANPDVFDILKYVSSNVAGVQVLVVCNVVSPSGALGFMGYGTTILDSDQVVRMMRFPWCTVVVVDSTTTYTARILSLDSVRSPLKLSKAFRIQDEHQKKEEEEEEEDKKEMEREQEREQANEDHKELIRSMFREETAKMQSFIGSTVASALQDGFADHADKKQRHHKEGDICSEQMRVSLKRLLKASDALEKRVKA